MILRNFPGLSSMTFQHPLDGVATRALENTPGLGLLRDLLLGTFFERIHQMKYLGHFVRVEADQYASIHRRYLAMAQRLDVRRLPVLYIRSSPEVNAYAAGTNHYSIVLNTGLLDLLEEEEIETVLAHELGHVKCDHMKHLSMVEILRTVGPYLFQAISLPIAPAVLFAVQVALVYWRQKAELSADRAALLATQDCGAVQSALAKTSGYSPKHSDGINIEAMLRQGKALEDIGANSLIEKVQKAILFLELTHPIPVERIREIGDWASSREYRRILEGEYEKIEPLGPVCKQCPECSQYQPQQAIFCGDCGTNIREAPPLATPDDLR